MSPDETSVPWTRRSALIIEGAASRPLRFAGACGAAGTSVESLVLLENIATCPNEPSRIPHRIGAPHFVVDVWAGAAPRRSEFADGRAFLNFSTDLDENGRQMPVSRLKTIAMVNFDQISVSTTRPRIIHDTRCSCRNDRSPRAREIQTRME